MNPVHGHFHSGESLATESVEIRVIGEDLLITGEGGERTHPLAAVRVSDRLGRVPRFIYLPDGATVETPANDWVDAVLASRARGRTAALVHWLEQRTRIAVLATGLLVAAAIATVTVGLPAAARAVAGRVPPEVELRVGEVALQSVATLTGPSRLSRRQQARARVQAEQIAEALQLQSAPRLEFRSLGEQANAFALPGGIIILSDELVLLATDDELAAVLAHEIGHWQLKHGMQNLLRRSVALLLVAGVSGDLSTLTTFGSALPLTLLQQGYSRQFEHEADAYAVESLRLAGRDPRHLGTLLLKLENRRGPHRELTWLSTHPPTAQRLARIDPDGTLPGWQPEQKTSVAAASSAPVPLATPETRDRDQLLAAAHAGDPSAQYAIAELLLHAARGPEDESESYRWLSEAAAGGHEMSRLRLMHRYGERRSPRRDITRTRELVATLAASETPRIWIEAEMVRYIISPEHNERQAALLRLERAAVADEAWSMPAAWALAYALIHTETGSARDYVAGLEWLYEYSGDNPNVRSLMEIGLQRLQMQRGREMALRVGRGLPPPPLPLTPTTPPPTPTTATADPAQKTPATKLNAAPRPPQSPPRPIYRARPVYPWLMRTLGITGEVTVEFVVNTEGRVKDARTVGYLPYREFAHAAVEAVEQWRFQPGLVDGKPTNVRISVPIVFSLEE
jgi:TonB family protein